MTQAHQGVLLAWRAEGEVLMVALDGRITAERGEGLLDALCGASQRAAKHVIVDLSAVTAIDGAGVNALLDACVATTLRRGTFTLTGVKPDIRTVLRQAGVLSAFGFFSAEGAA